MGLRGALLWTEALPDVRERTPGSPLAAESYQVSQQCAPSRLYASSFTLSITCRRCTPQLKTREKTAGFCKRRRAQRDQCSFSQRTHFVGHPQVLYGVSANVRLGDAPEAVAVLTPSRPQLSSCRRMPAAGQPAGEVWRARTFDVQITSRRCTFIQLSHCTMWPLYVSPFFNSTSCGHTPRSAATSSQACTCEAQGGCAPQGASARSSVAAEAASKRRVAQLSRPVRQTSLARLERSKVSPGAPKSAQVLCRSCSCPLFCFSVKHS